MSYRHKNRKHGEIKKACLIEVAEFNQFIVFLSKTFNEINYKGTTEDGTSIEFENLDDLLAFPNFHNRRLTNIELSATGEENSLNVNFKKRHQFIMPETINYTLTYNDQSWGFKFEDDLRNELKEFVPSYNYLTYLEFSFALPLLLFLLLISYLGLDYFLKICGFSGYTDIDLTKISEPKGSNFIGIIWGLVILIGGSILNKIRSYLFPTIFISIGKQVKEFKKRQNIAKLLFGVILLGVLVNLLSDWLSN